MECDYGELTGRSFNDGLKNSTDYFCQTALELAGKRFRDCYIGKTAKWCCEHKIILTGHLFEDDNPINAERQNGDFLSVLSAFTMPGIDEIETNLSSGKLLPLLGAAEYAQKSYTPDVCVRYSADSHIGEYKNGKLSKNGPGIWADSLKSGAFFC